MAIIQQGVNFFQHSIPAESEADRKVLGLIEEAIQRADTIIHGLVAFSQTSAMKPDRLKIESVVENSLVLIGKQLDLKNIELVKEFGARQADIEGDMNKLQQAFMHIILNSLQAMPHGGRLTIRTSTVAGKKLKDGVGRAAKDFFAEHDLAVVCEVEDTGCGIPQEFVQRIFEPFFTTKRDIGAPGLGLSICLSIIESHHGLVYIESTHGVGTKVSVILKAVR